MTKTAILTNGIIITVLGFLFCWIAMIFGIILIVKGASMKEDEIGNGNEAILVGVGYASMVLIPFLLYAFVGCSLVSIGTTMTLSII